MEIPCDSITRAHPGITGLRALNHYLTHLTGKMPVLKLVLRHRNG